MTPIRVVLGDDRYLAREAVTSVLEQIPSAELVATAADFGSLRDLVDGVRPDVVVTDVDMPPTHTDEGIRLAVELRASHPRVGVVILSRHADPDYAVSLFEAGSDRRAYLLKARLKSPGELSRALRTVAAGGSVVDPYIVERLVATRNGRDPTLRSKLTPRELEILALIAGGGSNTAVATRLGITLRAVERHVNMLLSKLDLPESTDHNRRVQATLLYLASDPTSRRREAEL
jgi:DNA-binding NarL/FixJ family response regulator